MLNYKLILKIIGALLFIEALLMSVALVMSFLMIDGTYDDSDVPGFLITIAFTFMVGLIMRYYGQPESEVMNRRDAYLLVTVIWIVFSFFGSLPFLMSGLMREGGFTDAFFETMSGFTTTGSTVIDNIEKFPSGLKLWRSMTQWIGGLGIAFFTIAILPSLVRGGGVRVFSAEATGPIKTKMHPKLATNAKMIISVYLFLTVACAVAFWVEGMHPFDAANYAMTVTATGGFSPHNDSTIYYNSVLIDYTCVIFMFLSGTNFTMLYLAAVRRQAKNLFKDTEFHFYLSMVVMATVIVTLCIMISGPQYGLFDGFRNALFQVVSFVTTTGMFNDSIHDWPRFTWLVLFLLMFIGACAGSTSGGLKSVRAVMLVKVVRNELKRMLHPKAVFPLRVNGINADASQQVTLLGFFVAYVMLCMVTYTILMIFDNDWIDTVDAISIAISSASNVGPALGVHVDNMMSWAELSVPSKWCCAFLMLMGRLEVFTVLVLFTPAFWKNE